MANTARVTQSALELLTSQSGTVQITQNAVEFVSGAGIDCGNPPPGVAGVFYSHTFPSGGGTPPLTFSVTAGSLPPGLSLNASTGVVSGTPSTPGTYTFTVTVTDSMGTTSSVECSILISQPITNIVAGGGPYIIPRPCACDIDDLANEAIARVQQRRREWPYTWSFPPPGAIRVTAQNLIPVPTVVAGETQGLLYTVDQGFMFALEKIVVQPFTGAVAPGDFLWSLDVNRPVGVGTFQGSDTQGFTRVDVPLGTTEFPWPLLAPDVFNPNDAVRVKFFNVNLNPGAPNYLKSILLGWRWVVA